MTRTSTGNFDDVNISNELCRVLFNIGFAWRTVPHFLVTISIPVKFDDVLLFFSLIFPVFPQPGQNPSNIIFCHIFLAQFD